MSEKMFAPEASGDKKEKDEPLLPHIKEALEKFRKKQGSEEKPIIDADMAQLHQMVRVMEESLFELVRDVLRKSNAPKDEIEKLKNDYKEYTECWDKSFSEKGGKLSVVKDVYPRLPSSNTWLQYSKRITEKYFGIERN